MNSMSDSDIVQHVLRHKTNYYRILMIETTATDAEIKSAYRKMALKCHPDKNSHTQAAEAFKLVGTANTTLSDATRRRIYDRRGAEAAQRYTGNGAAAGAGPRRRPGQPHGDFFEEFFGGGRGFYPYGGPPGQQFHAEVNVPPNVILMIPIVLFFLMAVLLQVFNTEKGDPVSSRGGQQNFANAFSFTPNYESGYVMQRSTISHGLRVTFFTTRRISELMDRRKDVFMTVEKNVLEAHRDSLGRQCEAETFKFRSRGKKEAPPVCEQYNRFRRALS